MAIRWFRGTALEVENQPIIDRQFLFDKDNGNFYVDEVTEDGTKIRQAYGAIGGTLEPLPVISINAQGYWMIGEVNTGVLALGTPGAKGNPGTNGTPGEDGTNGTQIEIDPITKNWILDGVDSGIRALGLQGPTGTSGSSNFIKIRYADDLNGTQMSSTFDPTHHLFIGFYTASDDNYNPTIQDMAGKWIRWIPGLLVPNYNAQTNQLSWVFSETIPAAFSLPMSETCKNMVDAVDTNKLIKFRRMTESAYAQLAVKDPDTIYFVE